MSFNYRNEFNVMRPPDNHIDRWLYLYVIDSSHVGSAQEEARQESTRLNQV
jgi:hypothetical protein